MRVHGEFQPHMSPGGGRADRHPGSTVGPALRKESRGFSEKFFLWKWYTVPNIHSEGYLFTQAWGQFKWRYRIIWTVLNCNNWFKWLLVEIISKMLCLDQCFLYPINILYTLPVLNFGKNNIFYYCEGKEIQLCTWHKHTVWCFSLDVSRGKWERTPNEFWVRLLGAIEFD